MSNCIEFYSSEQLDVMIPAGVPVVYINGSVCGIMSVGKVVKASFPEFGWAQLHYDPARMKDDSLIKLENIESVIPMGSSVSICQYYNSGFGRSHPEPYVLFNGYVEEISTEVTEKGFDVIFKARDLSARLERIMVSGQRVEDAQGTVFLFGRELTFNPDGCGNRSESQHLVDGKQYYCFSLEQSDDEQFSYADAIHYLLNEYLLYGMVQVADLECLGKTFSNLFPYDTGVDSLSLIRAINKLFNNYLSLFLKF